MKKAETAKARLTSKDVHIKSNQKDYKTACSSNFSALISNQQISQERAEWVVSDMASQQRGAKSAKPEFTVDES